MEKFIKNIDYATVLPFVDQVDYHAGQIVSKTLAQGDYHSLTLFAFEKGEEIATHKSDGDALVIALDGSGEVTVDGQKYQLKAGDSIIMPSQAPHAVKALERFKMFLVVLFTN